jgi:hypothetical protein
LAIENPISVCFDCCSLVAVVVGSEIAFFDLIEYNY